VFVPLFATLLNRKLQNGFKYKSRRVQYSFSMEEMKERGPGPSHTLVGCAITGSIRCGNGQQRGTRIIKAVHGRLTGQVIGSSRRAHETTFNYCKTLQFRVAIEKRILPEAGTVYRI
jgi:hypothetical protein